MASTKSLYTPNTTAFGHPSSLPILSCRSDDVTVTPVALAADVPVPLGLPDAAQAVEVDVVNAGSSPVTLWLLANHDSGIQGALLKPFAQAGLRRVVPAGAQLVEVRAVRGGDTLVMVASGALDVRVAVMLAGDAA